MAAAFHTKNIDFFNALAFSSLRGLVDDVKIYLLDASTMKPRNLMESRTDFYCIRIDEKKGSTARNKPVVSRKARPRRLLSFLLSRIVLFSRKSW